MAYYPPSIRVEIGFYIILCMLMYYDDTYHLYIWHVTNFSFVAGFDSDRIPNKGASIQDSIRDVISNSDVILVLLSPDYVMSRDCALERKVIVEMNKTVIVGIVERGDWKSWKDANGNDLFDDTTSSELGYQDIVDFGRLDEQIYADFAAAGCCEVNWSDGDISIEEKQRLTFNEKAMPMLFQLLERAESGGLVRLPKPSSVSTKEMKRKAKVRKLHELLSTSLKNIGRASSRSDLCITANENRFAGSLSHSMYQYDTSQSLENCMCISEENLERQEHIERAEGVEAIRKEFNNYGTKEDKELMDYVLNKEAGSVDTEYQDEYRLDCRRDGTLLPERIIFDETIQKTRGMRLQDFVNEAHNRGFNLSPAMVMALRLYSTKAYKSINDAFRDRERRGERRKYPFSVTMYFIDKALDELKGEDHSDGRMDLWRGYHDVSTIPEDFLKSGGTELAPMSTTSDLDVALKYAFRGEFKNLTIFRIRTTNSLERGADISWLSCFPAENEYLYRPITTLIPCDVTSHSHTQSGVESIKAMPFTFEIDGKTIVVLEVGTSRR